jgi:hypothetical protein
LDARRRPIVRFEMRAALRPVWRSMSFQMGSSETDLIFVIASTKYSQTCVQRPPSGPRICGRVDSLLTGGCCSEVGFCYKDSNWDSLVVVVAGK